MIIMSHGSTNKYIQNILILCIIFIIGLTSGCVVRPKDDFYFVSILDSIKKDTRESLHALGSTINQKVYGNDTLLYRFALDANQTDLTGITIQLNGSPYELDQWILESHIYTMDSTLASEKADGQPQPYNDVLVETIDPSLSYGSTREYVLFIQTKADIPNDPLTFSIQINADQYEKPKQLTVHLDPQDVTLDRDGFTIELWQHPFTSARYYDVEPFGNDHQKILLSMLDYYHQLGGKIMTATIVDEVWNHQSYDADPSLIQWIREEDGSFRFDYSYFDIWVSLGLTSGVLDLSDPTTGIKAYSIAPWNDQITYIDETSGSTIKEPLMVGSQPWIYYWTTFLEDFMVHCESMGIEDHIYISMDERDATTLQACIDLIETIHNSQGESFKISAAINSDMLDQPTLLDRIDDISFSLTALDGSNQSFMDLADHRHQLGLTTTIYTTTGQYPSSFVTSDPADTLFTLLYSYRLHASGFLRWSYDGWNEDPLFSSDYGDFQSGDPFLTYPLNTMVGPYITPSYRLLLIRYGLTMIHKIDYLSSIGQTKPLDQLNQWLYPNRIIDSNHYATYASPFDRLLLQSNVNGLIRALN